MALGMSNALANARLDAIETTIGTSPILRIYGGSVPADCAASIGAATLLFEVTLPSDWLEAALGGTKAARYWPIAVASASGTASFFRIFESTGTTCHVQGTCSTIGGGGTLILDSTTITSGRGLGIVDFVLRAPEAPAFSGALSKTLGTLTDSATGTVVTPSWTSIRFNQTQYENRWAYRSATMPTGEGILVSLWAKMPTPVTSHPTTLGNTEVLRINFSNWYLRCISFNFNTTSGSVGDLNTNSMLFADGTAVSESATSWVNDTTYRMDTGVPWSYENGWIFLAWQAVCDGSGNLTLRQWVRYAGQSVAGPDTSSLSLSTIRSDLQSNAGWTAAHANAWTPSQTISQVQINGGDGNDAYITSARVEETTGTPTNAHILDLSNLTEADSTAWADWSLRWESGAATLTDRSGNSRDLTGAGGALASGGTFP